MKKLYLFLLTAILPVFLTSCQSLYLLNDKKYEPLIIKENIVFGSRGTGADKFELIDAIVTDKDGNIYIGDKQGCVHKFDENGKFLKAIGTQGSGPGQFWSEAKGLAIDSKDRLICADMDNARVNIFSLDGAFISSFGKGFFSDPQGIAMDSEDNIYVSDNSTGYIYKFSADGKYLLKFGGSSERYNRNMTYVDEKVMGKQDGKFNSAESMAIKDDRIYVADENNSRIQIFDLQGKFIQYLGEEGIGEGLFYDQCEGLCFDNSGYLFAVNESKGKWGSVNVFDNELKPVLKFQASSYMVSPDGIAFDAKNNRILVVDQGNWQVRIFSMEKIKAKLK